ncbi:uncharacterized protein LOC132564228 [Ylistrum balloti]|uniref:uncharacterized protein LOC132564228 n=1 Tax=Ylistrum balloti TaxID=509963 RepID=UPI002905822A|nr:uncharacterized protein LOC132564228 [Ylistrum balloti]
MVSRKINERCTVMVIRKINERSPVMVIRKINERSTVMVIRKINERSPVMVIRKINERSPVMVIRKINERSPVMVIRKINERCLDPEDPPFQVPKDTTPVRKVTHHKFSVDEHLRKKRDNTADMGGFKRLPRTECGPWFKRLLSYTKGRPLHLSKVIAVNDSIEIPCYYCGDPASYRPPHRAKPYWMWRTLGRNTTEDGLWTYSSVLRGFRRHDKEFESRVNITSNDSLIIRNIQEKDSGMYFCARQVGTLTMWTFTEDVVNWFLRQSDQKYLRLFFHIDVSTTDKAFPTPAPTIKDYRANLALFTYWGEWSTCSVCGEEGERWRTGICWARMIKDKYMEPAVFYHALLSSRRGMPCRSTLFKYFRGWRLPDRPDEKMVQACTIPCVNNTLTQRMTINLDKARYKDLAKV